MAKVIAAIFVFGVGIGFLMICIGLIGRYFDRRNRG